MAILYRCKTPTDWLCPCGKCARRLRGAGVSFDEVRVPVLKRDRDEVDELTGQRWVPVLVDGDEIVHEAHRITEYVEWAQGANASCWARAAPRPSGRARRSPRLAVGVGGEAPLGPPDAAAAGP